jgi:hypothetical protein
MKVFHADRTHSYCIKRVSGNLWPRNLAAFSVHCDYKVDSHSPNSVHMPNLRWGVLHGWQQAQWQRDGDNHNRIQWLAGKTAEEFWRRLIESARTNGTIWVFAWDVWPSWCLLDGKREIDEGRLLLDIGSSKEADHLPGKRPHRSQGLFVADNPPTIICLAVPGGGRIKMIDLANYGIKKEHYGIMDEKAALAATVQALKDYHRLCQVYDLGSLQTTAASQSFYAYRRSHMFHDIVTHPTEKVISLERAAYYGGRCECLRLGHFREKLYHLDVNLMYTALGLITPFPRKHIANWTSEYECQPIINDKFQCLIADVTIHTQSPYFPVREKVKFDPNMSPIGRGGRERIIYPVGTFRTALAGPELAVAMAAGCVVKWHRVQYYEPAPLMKHWSQFAIDMRATCEFHKLGHLRSCIKRIINALPGKWGQRSKKWVDFDYKDTSGEKQSEVTEWIMETGLHPATEDITTYRTIAGKTQYMDCEELCATSCPSIAAFWTSAGRVYLYGIIEQAGRNNVFYYDTDSVIVNETGYLNIYNGGYIHSQKAGSLKVKEESDDVEILGIRRYRFGKRWCVAGPFGGEQQGTGEIGVWEEHEGFAGQLWHSDVGKPVKIKRKGRWRREYKHGIVDKQGNIHPFRIPLDPAGSEYIMKSS